MSSPEQSIGEEVMDVTDPAMLDHLNEFDLRCDPDPGDGSRYFSDTYSRSRSRIRETTNNTRFPFIINLDEQVDSKGNKTVPKPKSAPTGSITWEVSIWTMSKEGGEITLGSYISNEEITRPLTTSQRQKDAQDQASALDLTTDDDQNGWKGPVLIVSRRAHADNPQLNTIVPDARETARPLRRSKRRPTEILARDMNELPKTPAELNITYWSHADLTIRSPHLYLALSQIIEHDPWFAPYHPETYYSLRYPYFPVLQNLPRIKAWLESSAKVVSKPAEHEDQSFDLQKGHLQILYEFLSPFYESLVVPCLQGLNTEEPEITFDAIWYLFQPGTEIYAHDETTDFYAAKVQGVGAEDNKDWIVDVWVLSSDGVRIARQMKTMAAKIPFFEGARKVSLLPICPTRIYDRLDRGSRRRKALERGRLLEKSLRQGHLLVKNDASSTPHDFKKSDQVVVDERRGKVLCEAEQYCLESGTHPKDVYNSWDNIWVNEQWTMNPEEAATIHTNNSRPARPQVSHEGGDGLLDLDTILRNVEENNIDTRREKALNKGRKRLKRQHVLELSSRHHRTPRVTSATRSKDQRMSPPLTDEQAVLLYPMVWAYSLIAKTWISVDTGRLTEVEPSDLSMKNLVIDPDELRTIKALASRLGKPQSWGADFISGKGSGAIILLHGPPGVGKTYTVEAIAELLHRPLLTLTVADIGTVETKIENELTRWFALAGYWNGVILIDEADIFLERRQNRDLARNGLVSAFLRRAEYFDGLLFLTTNRVGQIDDAFISRVHVAIQYRTLVPEDLRRIWSGFFSKLARERKGKIQVSSDAKKWVLDKFGQGEYNSMNGRDIRNALQTAITLAEFEAEEDPDFDSSGGMVVMVSQKNFEKVLDMSHRFRNYVTGIRKEDERKRAQARGDRNDYEDDTTTSLPLRSRRT